MKSSKLFRTATISSLIAFATSMTGMAGDTEAPVWIPPAEPAKEWEFSLGLYALLAGIEGEAQVGDLSADIDVDFEDILDNLDMTVMVTGQARRGKFSLQGDFIYLATSVSDSINDRAFDRVKLELDTAIFTGIAAYRVWECPEGYLELGGGFRMLNMDTDIKLEDNITANPTVKAGSSKTAWDGIVAARYVRQFSSKWSLRIYGDIGAGDSDLTWQLWANVGYALSDRATFLAGYRHLTHEFDSGNTSLDLDISGPQLGVLMTF